MDLKEMTREKVNKVICENQSSAIRGLKALFQYLMIYIKYLKTKNKEKKQASKKERPFQTFLFSVRW